MSDPTIEISILDVYWKETANCPNCVWFASMSGRIMLCECEYIIYPQILEKLYMS